MVAAAIRTIFAQPDAAAVVEQLDSIAEKLGRQFSAVEAMLRDAQVDICRVRGVPAAHWLPRSGPRIRSSGSTRRSSAAARQRRGDPRGTPSRFVMLVALPDGHTADVVADALAAKITELPIQLRRSVTWDQGREMAEHARFTVETGVPVYFCDPRSPWQRGSNENTNGLLRQYFPKRSDLRPHTQAHLDAVAAELNDRPRQTLGWKSPSHALDEALR